MGAARAGSRPIDSPPHICRPVDGSAGREDRVAGVDLPCRRVVVDSSSLGRSPPVDCEPAFSRTGGRLRGVLRTTPRPWAAVGPPPRNSRVDARVHSECRRSGDRTRVAISHRMFTSRMRCFRGGTACAPARNRFPKTFRTRAQHPVGFCESTSEGTMDSRGGDLELLLCHGIISPFPVACVHQPILLSHSFADGEMP